MHWTNHLLSNLIVKLNTGLKQRLRFIKVDINDATLEFLELLYKHGAIRHYRILKDLDKIDVFLKYHQSRPIIKFSVISTPGNREYWNLKKLSRNYNRNNFSGFYVVSTQKGLYTSDYCLLIGNLGGEVLLKVEV